MENSTVYEVIEISRDAPHEPTHTLFSSFDKALAHAEKVIKELAEGAEDEIKVKDYRQGKEFTFYQYTVSVFPVTVN